MVSHSEVGSGFLEVVPTALRVCEEGKMVVSGERCRDSAGEIACVSNPEHGHVHCCS